MGGVGEYIVRIDIEPHDDMDCFVLVETEVTRRNSTKRYGSNCSIRKVFNYLDAYQVDCNTKEMEEAIDNGKIIIRDAFILTDKIRPMAEKFVEWCNVNIDKTFNSFGRRDYEE